MARYNAYVLRVWRSGAGGEGQWAGRVEHLTDGATLRFGSLTALLAYLSAELAIENGAHRNTLVHDRPVAQAKGETD